MNGIDVGIKSEITDDCSGRTKSREDYAVVNKIYNTAFQFPIYDDLSQKDIDKIENIVNAVLVQR